MVRRFFILLSVIGLFSCEKNKSEIADLSGNDLRLHSLEKNHHTYDDLGKLITTTSVLYYYAEGLPDSIVTLTRYGYDGRGRLINEEDPDGSRTVYQYNELDSLTALFFINDDRDTTILNQTEYDNGKIRKQIFRRLEMNISQSLDDPGDDVPNYDTIYEEIDYAYKGDLKQQLLTRDKTGALTASVYFFYEGDRVVKSVSYGHIGDQKYVRETTVFPFSLKDHYKDYIRLSPDGDTLGYFKTIRKDSSVSVDQFEDFIIQTIFKEGKISASVMYDLNAKEKTIETYAYDELGNVVEQKTLLQKFTFPTEKVSFPMQE